MIQDLPKADIILLTLSSKQHEFEAGVTAGRQTYQHVMLAAAFGTKKIVVAVTKMDSD